MTGPHTDGRYQAWLESESGAYALSRCRDMLRRLLSGWPRRSRSVLVFNAGSGDFLETLWEAGFDVTAQENDAAFLETARARLGSRAEFVLSAPDRLPFDDCSFDYAVAACALEFWERPEAVLEEIGRLACSGVILIVPNAWSLFGMECRLRKSAPLCASARPLLQSPLRLHRLARRIYGGKKAAWASVLPGVSFTWKNRGLMRLLNGPIAPLPLGAFTGLRIDFGRMYAGTPTVISSRAPVASAE